MKKEFKEKDFSEYGLSEEMLKSIAKLGYENPTSVQEQVIPAVHAHKDIIVKSQTGSGKTAAFAIPICENLELEIKNPQVLVLVPTRELAVQVKEEFSYLGRFKKIRCAAVFGKQSMEAQKKELRQRVHVIVGTPGRTFDHIERKTVNLEEVKYLVIDEADKMLDMGFIDQVEAIIKELPRNRVTMLFSATMPEEIEKICSKYMRNPEKIEIISEEASTVKIHQHYYEVEEINKWNLFKRVIYVEKPESCIIFCNTREKVEDVLTKMQRERFYCEALHGGMEQRDRLDVIARFKKGEFHFLVATDVAARGIHVDNITHIVNYEVPMEQESYVHRIGRTGRVGNEGTALTLASPREMKFLRAIEEYVNYKIPQQDLPLDEAVEQGREDFEIKIKSRPAFKESKTDNLNRDITRIRINAGKKQKMRPGDIVGAITSISGVSVDDIGIIDVQDTCSYVEIFGINGSMILKRLQEINIKGKVHTVRKVMVI